MVISVGSSYAECMEPIKVRHLVGKNVLRLRVKYAIRQQDVSAKMRDRGVRWEPSTLSSLESGDKAVSIEVLVLLADSLNALTLSGEVGVPDLLADTGEPVRLSSTVEVNSGVLAGLFSQRGVDVGTATRPERKDPLSARYQAGDARILRLLGENADVVERGDYAPRGEAERFQARKLGVPAEEVMAASIGLFGLSLTDERDARIGILGLSASETTQRGHITRDLARKIRERLEAEKRGELPDPPTTDKGAE